MNERLRSTGALVATGTLIVLGLACAEKKTPAPPPEASPATAAPKALPSVPVPADFEAEAEAEITPKNYLEQLDALEAEIEK